MRTPVRVLNAELANDYAALCPYCGELHLLPQGDGRVVTVHCGLCGTEIRLDGSAGES